MCPSLEFDVGYATVFMATSLVSAAFFWFLTHSVYMAVAIGIYCFLVNVIYARSIMPLRTRQVLPPYIWYVHIGSGCLFLFLTFFGSPVLPFLTVTTSRSHPLASEELKCYMVGSTYQRVWKWVSCARRIEELTPSTNSFMSMTSTQMSYVTYANLFVWTTYFLLCTWYIVYMYESQRHVFTYACNLAYIVFLSIIGMLTVTGFATTQIYASVGTSETKAYLDVMPLLISVFFLLTLTIDLSVRLYADHHISKKQP